MRNILFLIIVYGVFSSCCDDDGLGMARCLKGLDYYSENAPISDDTTFRFCYGECEFIECEEIYSSDIPFDYYYPCFNPKNAEQLAYCRDRTTDIKLGYELWVIDFCNGEQKMLADNVFYGLDWSVKDWLIYTGTDQNIWKIKSNGDSLTQLTFVGDYNRYPKWSPKGDRLAFQRQTGNNLSILIIVDEDGVVLDTIEQLTSVGQWSWIDENRICYMIAVPNTSPTIEQMNYYNLETKEIKFLHNLTIGITNDSIVLYTASMPNENSVIWLSMDLIGKTNLSTGKFEILRHAFRQEWFQEQLTIRPGDDQILYSNRVMHSIDECHLDSEFGFFLIDVDGMNNKRIKIPE